MSSPKVSTIAIEGVLDGTKADQVRQTLNAAINEGADILLFNCEQLTFMDSSGLGLLVHALKMVRAAKRKMMLCSLNKQVSTLFQLTEMYQVFQVYEDLADFEEQVLNRDA
ncbi:anti-sigma factor antagonist [Synechococcales cyanobacterium C]|uniref:Anti-sigma factor antagonist n=1 Tax=Petrachloros mirabilis ULC683 TaxID=2781853 RepID=A0A8K2A2N7_9CYAN|nr:STAS domain-containing protein [Petrachloros mirabilis]NCJ08723.1 anti-sigma factor antagonist [Petrachloros mirabilis ULC683]